MHELSLCQNAVELITQQLAHQHVNKVTAVWFELGALACVEEQALHFAFNCASQGTILAGAQVHIIKVPAKAWCWDCSCSVDVENAHAAVCPLCQGQNLRLNVNDGFRVKEVEVQ